jgi:hypothetical protein
MKAPRLSAWHKETQTMELPEDIFMEENIHMFLNEDDYIWMRTTELFDKNKKEMFEGDIAEGFLNWDNQSRYSVSGKIIFHMGNFYVGATLLSAIREPKILGNDYENPELMEKQ